MSNDSQSESFTRARELSPMILQIDSREDERPLQFPAVIRNLGGGLVTLEITNPWTIMDWKTLKGRKGSLHLVSADAEESAEIRGTVIWAKYLVQDQANGHLNLGLKLADPDQSSRQLLFDRITHSPNDIKGLWNRWEQVRGSSGERLSTRNCFIAVGLLMSALALQMVGPPEFKIVGWLLWLLGTVLLANQTLRFWRNRDISY